MQDVLEMFGVALALIVGVGATVGLFMSFALVLLWQGDTWRAAGSVGHAGDEPAIGSDGKAVPSMNGASSGDA